MLGLTEVKAMLLATPAVVSSVGTYSSKPAIYGKPVVPQKYSGKAISMYLSAATNGGLDILENTITVNCYGSTYNNTITIQDEVYTALNRESYESDTFFRCSKLPVLPASQTADDYNAPVEVLVRKR